MRGPGTKKIHHKIIFCEDVSFTKGYRTKIETPEKTKKKEKPKKNKTHLGRAKSLFFCAKRKCFIDKLTDPKFKEIDEFTK